jgi:S-adenosylmethionine-dependent methyltransferase
MTDKLTIAAAYNAGVDDEYNRLVETPLRQAEFALISELLTEYISAGSTIIDIGAGPGRYAEFLLSHNCKVGVIDLSERSLNVFQQRINGDYGSNLIFSRNACATELGWLNDSFADAVLLMGPLYHLTSGAEREKAIEHAFRILKPGGVIFAIFLSPYPKLNPLMESNEEMLFDDDFVHSIQHNGITEVSFQGYRIEQYRCWPSTAKAMMENQGFNTKRMRNIEGIGSFFSSAKVNGFSTEQMAEMLLNTLRNTCENPNLLGITSQYLYVGMK